jgi:hypothetical protein
MSGALGGQNTSGVVMTARCAERLVGRFDALAVDISVLRSFYLEESCSEEAVDVF